MAIGPIQHYPRDDSGLLEEAALRPHTRKLSGQELRDVIVAAIDYANGKASRAILNIPDGTPEEEVRKKYRTSGRDLFRYFVRYCGDPASTAHQCNRRHYKDVAREQFQNRTLQKERMNSGWRYQHIAKDGAARSSRFTSVSDIGTLEADFNATIKYLNRSGDLTIYVSVKNRENTMGGQDWPKAILALEAMARKDKNRAGDYICVFGIAMQCGQRHMKKSAGGAWHSNNTEVWRSDFFWPFFINMSYQELIRSILQVLMETEKPETLNLSVPDELLESFGDCCREKQLLDEDGCFNDPYKLVTLLCGVKE